MNEELIQKLVDQCVDKRERYGRTVEVLQSRKFAELIVRECMEQVWYTREDGINGNVSEVIKDRMKQHFGVEE